MKSGLRQRARELGFDDCRVTTAHPPESAARLQSWLSQERHGEMLYLERNAAKRFDPQKVLPGARSIITLAASYASPAMVSNGSPSHGSPSKGAGSGISAHLPAGVVARYARYADYHQVLRKPLRALTEFLNDLGGPRTRSLWYVDTGPVLERDYAQRAGLGFIGKHTNLISRRLGNWIFLAEILTTLELEPDAPERNHCGSCTRCMSACPTAAITAPFQLDARRCISYLTIELKGPIPIELRPAIGNRIYGCDDCLAACPWNRFAHQGHLMRASAQVGLERPNLLELLALDEAGFKKRFGATPIARARRRGLQRNVCVALGNTGDASALPALQQAAKDQEPLIAEHAHWAIEQIRSRPGP